MEMMWLFAVGFSFILFFVFLTFIEIVHEQENVIYSHRTNCRGFWSHNQTIW